MQRVCFVLHIRPERIEEYRLRHREVWPEMQDALRQAGWRDYSLFLRPDGMLIGYLVTDNFKAAREAMKLSPINSKWQEHMAPFFQALETHPDDHMHPLEEVFHLD